MVIETRISDKKGYADTNFLSNPVFIVLVSAVVSALVTTIFENAITQRIQRRYDQKSEALRKFHEMNLEEIRNASALELEKAKVSLQSQVEESAELRARRFTLYPPVIELTYRIRNTARQLWFVVAQGGQITQLRQDIKDLYSQLNDKKFVIRFDMERDEIFPEYHRLIQLVAQLIDKSDEYATAADHVSIDENNTHHLAVVAEIKTLSGFIDIAYRLVLNRIYHFRRKF